MKSFSTQPITAQSLGALLKTTRDIMRKDKGLNGDLDLPMLTSRRSGPEETHPKVRSDKSESAIGSELRHLGWCEPQNSPTSPISL